MIVPVLPFRQKLGCATCAKGGDDSSPPRAYGTWAAVVMVASLAPSYKGVVVWTRQKARSKE